MANPFTAKLAHFADLSAADCAASDQATGNGQKVRANKDLIREGDTPGSMFVMLDGWAMRYKVLRNGSRQITAFLMPGDACDLHVGLLGEMDHSIQTLTAARVATVSRDDMDRLLAQHPNIARAMYIAQLADEGTLRAWIVSMGRRSSIERVAHLTCELYIRAHWKGLHDAKEFEVPLSQLVLADALGMTPVHVNRILRDLRLAGVMTVRRGHVSIIDPVKLANVAGFDENYLHRRLRAPGS